LSILKIPTAEDLRATSRASRATGVYGGRGSGKSHFFGELLVETCQAKRGTLAVCVREVQWTLAQSSKRPIESKIASLGAGRGFKLFNDKIETPGEGLINFRGVDQKSRRLRIAWIDETQTLSARSLALLRPTIRAEIRSCGLRGNPWAWSNTLYWRKTWNSASSDAQLETLQPPSGLLAAGLFLRFGGGFPAE
jgi:phage terminase large subunit